MDPALFVSGSSAQDKLITSTPKQLSWYQGNYAIRCNLSGKFQTQIKSFHVQLDGNSITLNPSVGMVVFCSDIQRCLLCGPINLFTSISMNAIGFCVAIKLRIKSVTLKPYQPTPSTHFYAFATKNTACKSPFHMREQFFSLHGRDHFRSTEMRVQRSWHAFVPHCIHERI